MFDDGWHRFEEGYAELASAAKVKSEETGTDAHLVERIYFRSKMERNWAKYLSYLMKKGTIANWLYEPATFWFPLGMYTRNVCYKPDFMIMFWSWEAERQGFDRKLPFEFHEVKGIMDSDGRVKIGRMRKHYPAIRLRIIGRSEYAAVAKNDSKIIPGWEE